MPPKPDEIIEKKVVEETVVPNAIVETAPVDAPVVPVVDRVDADVVAPVAIAVPVSLATRTSPTCSKRLFSSTDAQKS